MYHHHTTSQDSTIRIFSPVVIFHDATTDCISDTHVIQLQKQKVNAMLKSNGQFWSTVISSTRPQNNFSPPQTPPPTLFTTSTCSSNSSVVSYTEQQHKYYNTPSKTDDEDTDMDDEEEDDLEVVAIEEDCDPAPTSNNKSSKSKKATNNNNGRKRRGNLPKSVTAILKQWLIDHCKHPYPTEEEKRSLRLKTNLTLNQISNWFINARRRILPLILSSDNKETKVHKDNEKKGKTTHNSTTRRKRAMDSSEDIKQTKQLCLKGNL